MVRSHTCECIGHFSSCKSQKATKQINSTSDIGSQETSVRLGVEDRQMEAHNSGSGDQEFAFQINSVSNSKRIMIDVKINEKPVTMQLDTAADVSVIPVDIANNIPRMCVEPYQKVLKDYNNRNVDVVGSAKVAVQYGAQKVSKLPITIVKGPG